MHGAGLARDGHGPLPRAQIRFYFRVRFMYQANASGLNNVVSVATQGHTLDATASLAYAQVGDDHAPGRWQGRSAPSPLGRVRSVK